MPILFLIVFVGMAGFGIIFPLLPFLGEQMGISDTAVGWVLASYSIGQLIGGPVWGRLSDTYGRRPILIWSTALSALTYVMLAYVSEFYGFFFVRLISGIMAGNISTAFAYATDLSDDKNRAKYLGWVSAAFAMGFFVGPMIGGVFAGDSAESVNFFLVSMIAAAITGVAFIGAIPLLKESLADEHRKPLNLKVEAPKADSFKVFAGRQRLLVLVLLSFLVVQAGAINTSVLAFWIERYLDLGPRDISFIFGYIAFLTMVMHGGAVGPAVHRFGEGNTLRLSLIIYAVSLGVLSFNATFVGLMVAMTLLAIGFGVFTPALNSVISKTAAANERGAVMGVQQSAASLARITGPILSLWVFDIFQGGSAFFLAAATLVPGILLAFWVTRKPEDQSADDASSQAQS